MLTALSRIPKLVYRTIFESPRWLFNACLVALCTVVYSYYAHDLFNAIPRIDDSVAAVYQARVFAEGRLLWPLPADLHAWFDMFGVLSPLDKPDFRAGMYTPGWSILLVPGVLIGKTWLINPLLAGCMLVMVSELGHELFNRVTGRAAALIGLVSPFIGAVAASQLSHISAALFVTLSWWLALRLFRTGRHRYALLAGLCLGFTLLIRPETAVLVGGVIAIGLLMRYRRALELWKSLAMGIGLCVVFGLALLSWQNTTVGSPGKVGHSLEMEGGEKLGFGKVPKSNYHYTVVKAVDHTKRRFQSLNKDLLGWPIPAALVLLAPFFLLRCNWRDFWLVCPLLVLSGFYFFYWYFEFWLHARYLFPAVPALLILAARGVSAWQYRLSQIAVHRNLTATAVLAACVYAVVVGAPQYFKAYPPHHGDVEDVLPKLVKAAKLENALVFYFSSGKLRKVGKWNDYYATAAYFNTLNFDGDVVFARDGWIKYIKQSNAELIAAYPGRNYYLYDFDQYHRSARLWQYVVEGGRIVSRELIALYDKGYIRTFPNQEFPNYEKYATARYDAKASSVSQLMTALYEGGLSRPR